jgi:DNA repair exonuclease SbcCD ATPase subunit
MEGRDLSSAIVKLPIDGAAMVVQILQQLMEKSVQQIYEITGLSDIIRGSTKASETATAQQIKAQYANVRLQDKINTINTMFREVMRMFSEVISEHFKPEILTTMTGVQVTPQMQQLMMNDLARSFSIDVETDSTIAMDEQADKQSRNEMLQSVTAYLQQVGQAKQAGLITADIAKELLLINVRGYKHAKNLEDMVQSMDGSAEQMQQMQQQLQQMQQQSQEQIQNIGGELQQAQGEIQRLNGVISEFNQQEEQRKNIETQGEAQKDQAQAQKEMAQAGKLAAETNKINMEAQTMGLSQLQVGL